MSGHHFVKAFGQTTDGLTFVHVLSDTFCVIGVKNAFKGMLNSLVPHLAVYFLNRRAECVVYS